MKQSMFTAVSLLGMPRMPVWTKIINIYFLNACLHCYLNANKLGICNTVLMF
jgi:hypothetical protein